LACIGHPGRYLDYHPIHLSEKITGGKMIKVLSSRLFWGMVLVIGGVLLLLDTFGIFKGGALFWTIVSVVAGLLFLSLFITNRENWWALIPGIIFLAIAAMVGLNSFVPGFSETNYSGTIILGGIALSFLLVYIARRSLSQYWIQIRPISRAVACSS
jgi:hypothetical protein